MKRSAKRARGRRGSCHLGSGGGGSGVDASGGGGGAFRLQTQKRRGLPGERVRYPLQEELGSGPRVFGPGYSCDRAGAILYQEVFLGEMCFGKCGASALASMKRTIGREIAALEGTWAAMAR